METLTEDSQASLTAEDLASLADTVRGLFETRDRRHGLNMFESCFVGSEAVEQLIARGIAADVVSAEQIGNLLLNAGIFNHVQRAHAFKNDYLFYRFAADEDHGTVAKKQDGSQISWADFIPLVSKDRKMSLLPMIPDQDADLGNMQQVDLQACGVSPLDKHNVELLDNVHPKSWTNPTPKEKYNLVALGAGAGGLITSGSVAAMGGHSALIESHLLGGDCLNVGCVPSKALLSAAKMVSSVHHAADYGITIKGDIEVDFPKVMERLRSLRAGISSVDAASRYADQKGVDVFLGRGTFINDHTVAVEGKELHFTKAVVATGGTAAVPNIPGLSDAPYITNASVFNLTELPKRMAVIGAGPIGLELAQAFQRFGSQVSIFSRSDRILSREDPTAAKIIEASVKRDGIKIEYQVDYRRVESRAGKAPITLVYQRNGAEYSLEVDALLIATGRKPNVSGIGLEAAGVEYDLRTGIKVNDNLQTTNRNIYAVGDVATHYQFTHVADFMARIVVRNAVAFGREKFSNLLIPWATYTDPEVAHVGLYETDLEARQIEYTTYSKEFEDVDRAVVDGHTEGFVKIHVKKGSDEILGATIVCSHAGELISEVTVAMQAGMGLGTLASVIHPYPTLAEAIRHCGDLYNSSRLTPTVKNIFHRLLALQR